MNKEILFTFLGTSAADFSLLRATDCHDRFDKNARRASCMMIEENILIDCGMHVNVDILIIDATCGDYLEERRLAEHNSIPMLRLMVPFLKTAGIIHEATKIYLTHIAPSLHKPHDETQELVKADGFIVAYDGLTFTV